MMELLSVACLSVAAKMEEIDVPALLDLQVNSRPKPLVVKPNTFSDFSWTSLRFQLT
jgi:hypothetical protein